MKSHALKLIDGDNPTSKILNYLAKFDYYDDDNFIIPTAKMIEAHTGVKYSKIRKCLEEIYSKLSNFDAESKTVFEFTEVEVIFYVFGSIGSASFRCENLFKIPQLDESIDVPFFKELTGTTMYFVKSIKHYLNDKKQQILISLKAGFPNSYLKIRKDMAYETGELNYFNTLNKTEFEIRKMLDIRKGRVW